MSDACYHFEYPLISERSSKVKTTSERTLRYSPICKSIEHEKGRRNEALSITSRYRFLALLKIILGRQPIQDRPRKGFPKETSRDQNTPLRKVMVQENLWIRGQRSSNGTQKQKRSSSETRAEPERSKGSRKKHGTPKERSRFRNYIISKRGISFFPRRIIIPGYALHEKGLQRQIGVDTLVNSQQRRALAVPVINR